MNNQLDIDVSLIFALIKELVINWLNTVDCEDDEKS